MPPGIRGCATFLIRRVGENFTRLQACHCPAAHYLGRLVNRSFLSLFALAGLALPTSFFTACSSADKAAATPEKPAYTAIAGPTEAADIPEPVVGKTYTTASRLQYEVLRAGTGKRPANKFERVRVHYHGYLPNGTVFDSSVDRGEPIVFGLGQVIPGWTEGVQLMREGSKYRFKIPHYLAYGEAGSPPQIGPRQTLMFDIELIEVVY